MGLIRHVLPVALLAVGATTAWAQGSAPRQLALAPLETIVITASGHEQELKDAPASISVIDGERLSQRFYRDVTDAIADVPGAIVTGGGDREDISLRGMGSSYTLILVDGQRQSSRETRPNSDGPGVEGEWTPPLVAIERIEVVRGPMSSLYGSDAIGGVINIITKKTPEHWRSEIRLDTTVQERSESGNIHQVNLFTAGSIIPDVLGLQVNGRFTQRGEDDIVGGFRGKDSDTLNVKLALTPGDDHEVILEAGKASQVIDATLGKTVEPLAPGEACDRRGCPESSTTEYDSETLALTHNGRWDRLTLRSYVKRDEYENRARAMAISNTDFQTLGTLPLGDHHVSFGGSYLQEKLDDRTSNQVSDRTTIEGSQWSLFAENEWQVATPFSLTTGLRYDDNDQFGGHWSPRLYGNWAITRDTTLKGGVSTGYSAPDLRATVPDWGQVSRGGNVYGNPDLEPETSVSQELGIYTTFADTLDTSLTVFHNAFEDKITRVACPDTICDAGPNQFGSLPTTRINIDEAVTQGIEITASADLNDAWSLSGNYTYTDSEQKTGEYAGSPLNQLPKHMVQTSVTWRPTDTFNGWLRVIYRGEESQPTTGPSQDSLIAPSYTTIDLGGNYQLAERLKLGVGIYNLGDEEINLDDYGYVEDGRRLWLSLAWSL
ncbi:MULTISPECIES: ligand-gated channel protein [unclassified Marinimicrobium]|uniref:ligand-gated channel protein n=2 Tax=Marinimicrobium TaxID=359337 RepID=UPI00257D1FE8|nr:MULTISPECIES: ligand-gated channel protein [unclassified Marinimicrobium]